ncbi:type VI secretion system Vgr family protein [Massilia sp. CFBP9026]|uniref:type VI secretion system Vgr family protein n=1 Tax=Massilia sp. CFBP9026 TaxID=3096536 RepID=UPI002A6A74A8|nr:type VI secretion system Vgr family protein [Massilia sp. CFBP9026]MDY0962394.1 type VI secretion system Vgr family protein [Massilia sp. CFBP9026]
MANALTEVLSVALAEFSGATRLIDLRIGERDDYGLLVEAFTADEAVQEVSLRDVIALSTSAYIPVTALLGQPATLELTLADGMRARFSGDICEAAMLGSDGGLARYRIRIAPWIWRLAHVRNCRVWQDKRAIDIVDAVFADYRPAARWRWSDEINSFMADALPRSYCCQYRESDLEFVLRLLAEEGLSFRVEETDDGHGLVLFADSSQPSGVPEDASSASDGGIRYHGVSSVEQRDSVQSLHAQQRLHASLMTVLSSDYKGRRSVSANSPSRVRFNKLPELESYDVPGQYAYANSAQARRYVDLQMQGKEARGQIWSGRSTVRTLRAGTRMDVTGAPLQQLGAAGAFTVLRVSSVGINNLPPPARDALAELFGPIPELLEQALRVVPADFGLAIAQARRTGYANCFEAIPSAVPWRPELPGSDGRTHAKPTARGAQSAIVVGMSGNDSAQGADELCCDRLGRVRIRFHWQDGGSATCWVRVAQRSVGFQFLPRIGQEVLVQFLENDIDRPVIVGALYNGQGEGGVVPTPGGERVAQNKVSPFEKANDHARSGQGNLAGGNSPVWHGASPEGEGHRNGAAQWGIRSKEFGGPGYSQLLFDDTDGQGRVQLRCSHAATELNLGHLVHSADNYRGSFRGLGVELRTDAYGTVRAGGGLLISSYGINHGASVRDAASENADGVGLVEQAVKVAEVFHRAATNHKTVGLAAHAGAAKAGSSVLDQNMAPMNAVFATLSGNVDIRRFDKTEDGPGMSELAAPMVAITAKKGMGVNAGQSLQITNGETVSMMAGRDAQSISGGQICIHSGQVIGVLGGTVKNDADDAGLQLIAAREAIDIQVQGDELKIQARDEVSVMSANAHIDWAAVKSISLSTAGGASIVIDGGNINVLCPGKIAIQAGKKSLSGANQLDYPLPTLPASICVECLIRARSTGSPFVLRSA